MISDVLHEARAEIESWLEIFPDTYAHFKEEIERLTAAMQSLQAKLDTRPTAEERETARRRVANPAYTPALEEALQHPDAFVEGMTEIDLSGRPVDGPWSLDDVVTLAPDASDPSTWSPDDRVTLADEE